MREDARHSPHSAASLERREFPRLKGNFKVRYGVCGVHGRQVPGFTEDMGIGGIRFTTPSTDAVIGDHIAIEIAVPGGDDPLYFLGQVIRLNDSAAGTEIAIRFDYLGKSDGYRSILEQFLDAHGAA
ncbi:MAG: PilZ domain-containing protein [Planctomycetota bacterium]